MLQAGPFFQGRIQKISDVGEQAAVDDLVQGLVIPVERTENVTLSAFVLLRARLPPIMVSTFLFRATQWRDRSDFNYNDYNGLWPTDRVYVLFAAPKYVILSHWVRHASSIHQGPGAVLWRARRTFSSSAFRFLSAWDMLYWSKPL